MASGGRADGEAAAVHSQEKQSALEKKKKTSRFTSHLILISVLKSYKRREKEAENRGSNNLKFHLENRFLQDHINR